MNKYIAECFGTMVLVLVGCGAAVIAGDQLWLLGVAFAFGLAVMTMVYTIWSVSGCHINPAISLAMWMRGKLSGNDFAWYVAAQLIGALIGAFFISLLAADPGVYAANAIGAGYTAGPALLGEVLFTALFITVIFGATSEKNGAGWLAGLVIGLTLAMSIMVIGPVSNASLNPARSFGPAMFAGGEPLAQFWMFIIGPVLWAVLAVVLWKYVMGRED